MTINISWPRFTALILLTFGTWTILLFGVLVYLFYEFPRKGVGLEQVALLAFLALGLIMLALSYFIDRRHDWAHLSLVLALASVSVSAAALTVKRVLSLGFVTPYGFGELVLGFGLSMFPLTATLFLLNKPVADAFRSSPDGQSGNGVAAAEGDAQRCGAETREQPGGVNRGMSLGEEPRCARE
jgi:hypothetical protein